MESIFQNILYLYLITKTFQSYFGSPSYHKFSIMRFFKFVIYLLNRDSCAKIIVFLFLIIKLFKQNDLLISRERAWRTNYRYNFPSLIEKELENLLKFNKQIVLKK